MQESRIDMKRVYVNEEWCLGCHLCEYYCAFAAEREADKSLTQNDMARVLKDMKINPRIKIEEDDSISFAVSCRHCNEPLCVKGCITGALSIEKDGVITIDKDRCIGCYTCILCCPYGAVSPSDDGVVQKCELCISKNGDPQGGTPQCVKGCPNGAIVFEERG